MRKLLARLSRLTDRMIDVDSFIPLKGRIRPLPIKVIFHNLGYYPLLASQRHWLIPAKNNSKWKKLDPHPTDYRVRMKVSTQARKANPALPQHWEARAIETVSRHGKRRILLTSLLDAKA